MKLSQEKPASLHGLQDFMLPPLLERGWWHVAAGWSPASPPHYDAMNAGRPELDQPAVVASTET
jgi:hypothetical protein